jgi:hypothetical protein
VEEVDVTVRPEVALKYSVVTTLAIAIGGQLAFTGVPGAEALREAGGRRPRRSIAMTGSAAPGDPPRP